MKKIISILIVLFTVSLSAKEQKVVVFDLVDTVKKPAGCEFVGESAYSFKYKENYRTANNYKYKKGDLSTVQRKYVIFSPKTKCPSFDKSKIFTVDGFKASCKITKVVKELDTYEASILQAVGNCRETIKKEEPKEIEDYLNDGEN